MITNAHVRAWQAHRQGLDGLLTGKTSSEILSISGWARSVAGVSPYLTFFSRAGISREQVDVDVAALEIHELPSARGCTYILPRADFALGLKLAQGFHGDRKTADKLGVTAKEIERLCEKVLAALAKGPLDPDGLREAAGNAVRNLGEEGKKKGLTTTLPVALEQLQTSGHIHRVSLNGRLDQQRYRYQLWRPNPLSEFTLSTEEAYTELARRFFHWIGTATIAEFQEFAGIGVKAAKDAVAPLKLEPLGSEDGRMIPPSNRPDFAAFQVPLKPCYSLVGSIDSMFQMRREISSLLDPEDARRPTFEHGPKGLGSHAILDRGRVVGLWEYDPEHSTIAWSAFIKPDKQLRDAVAKTEGYVRDQLGDARSFSLDTPKSRAPRIAALRAGSPLAS
jgi:hypothetical protein